MIFFALTKPKKKLGTILKVALVVILLAFLVPFGYSYLSDAGALAEYTASEEEKINPEPIRVMEEVEDYKPTLGESFRKLLQGEEVVVEIP